MSDSKPVAKHGPMSSLQHERHNPAPGPLAEARGFSQRPIKQLWSEYESSPTEGLRNYLIETFLHLVRYSAERIYARLPDEVDIEDLMSVGLFGLMDAIESYSLARGVKFETYCAPRISGAILDELRSMDWIPRLVRHRSSKVEGVRQKIEMEMGRKATDDEIAERLNIDDEEFQKYCSDSKVVGITSINRNCFGSDGNRELDVIKSEQELDPVANLEWRDLESKMIQSLTRTERLFIRLYYYEGLTMKQIGTTLNLSESWVSQLHSKILFRLKAEMDQREQGSWKSPGPAADENDNAPKYGAQDDAAQDPQIDDFVDALVHSNEQAAERSLRRSSKAIAVLWHAGEAIETMHREDTISTLQRNAAMTLLFVLSVRTREWAKDQSPRSTAVGSGGPILIVGGHGPWGEVGTRLVCDAITRRGGSAVPLPTSESVGFDEVFREIVVRLPAKVVLVNIAPDQFPWVRQLVDAVRDFESTQSCILVGVGGMLAGELADAVGLDESAESAVAALDVLFTSEGATDGE